MSIFDNDEIQTRWEISVPIKNGTPDQVPVLACIEYCPCTSGCASEDDDKCEMEFAWEEDGFLRVTLYDNADVKGWYKWLLEQDWVSHRPSHQHKCELMHFTDWSSYFEEESNT